VSPGFGKSIEQIKQGIGHNINFERANKGWISRAELCPDLIGKARGKAERRAATLVSLF
jgi:hypothetical protein